MIFHRPQFTAIASAPLLLLLSGCGSDAEVTVRELSEEEREPKVVDSSIERFRYNLSRAGQGGSQAQPGTAPGSSDASGTQGGPSFTYEVPDDWEKAPATAMRDLNFTFGEQGEGECYVTRLPGSGGGLVPNVNRWRQQMGAEPLSEEEVVTLPSKPLFGQPATYVSVAGEFAGMGTQEKQSNYRLLGLILSTPAGAVTVKMTGPRDLVDANEEAFIRFTETLDVKLE